MQHNCVDILYVNINASRVTRQTDILHVDINEFHVNIRVVIKTFVDCFYKN